MKINNYFKLIYELNKNNIVNIDPFMIYYNENIIYDSSSNIKEFKDQLKENNIDENELYYEFIIYYYDDLDEINIDEILKNNVIKEFEKINLKNYNIIDEFDDENVIELIVEINDDVDEIIKNIRSTTSSS